MTRLTVPEAPAGMGAVAPPVPNVAAGGGARAIADLGDRVADAGLRLEQSRRATAAARQRVAVANEIGEARLELERRAALPGVPSGALEQAWAGRLDELRTARLAEAEAEGVGDAIGPTFDEIAGRHSIALGSRLIDRDATLGRAALAQAEVDFTRSAAGGDPAAVEAAVAAYADTLADQVAAGHVSPEQAPRLLAAFEADRFAEIAHRLSDTDPAGYLAAVAEEPEWYLRLSPERRMVYDARSRAAVERDAERIAREAEASVIDAARGRAEAALREDPAGFAAALDAGEDWTEPFGAAERERLKTAALAAVARRDKAVADARADALRDGLREIAAIGAERVVVGETALLADPLAKDLPEYEAAARAVTLRSFAPEFARLPVAEMDAMIADERARPVESRADARFLPAMEAARAAAVKAWDQDPVAQAAAVGFEFPALPDDLSDAEALAGVFGARRNLADRLAADYGVEERAFFSAAEAKRLKGATGPAADPARRLELALTMAASFGEDAAGAFAAVSATPVFAHVGRLLAAGGDPSVGIIAFEGERALAAEAGRNLLNGIDRDLLIAEEAGDALDAYPEQYQAILATADAIYARDARGLDPRGAPSDATRLYADAVHQALGRSTDARGGVRGGVMTRDFGGMFSSDRRSVLLPPTVLHRDVQRAFDDDRSAAPEPWIAAAVGAKAGPTFAGEPITADVLDELTLAPVGPGIYQLIHVGEDGDVTLDAGDTGLPFTFDLEAWLDALAEARRARPSPFGREGGQP